jgi:hypothetical protein
VAGSGPATSAQRACPERSRRVAPVEGIGLSDDGGEGHRLAGSLPEGADGGLDLRGHLVQGQLQLFGVGGLVARVVTGFGLEDVVPLHQRDRHFPPSLVIAGDGGVRAAAGEEGNLDARVGLALDGVTALADAPVLRRIDEARRSRRGEVDSFRLAPGGGVGEATCCVD